MPLVGANNSNLSQVGNPFRGLPSLEGVGNPFRGMPSLQPRESESQLLVSLIENMFSSIEEGRQRMREAQLCQNWGEREIQVIPSGANNSNFSQVGNPFREMPSLEGVGNPFRGLPSLEGVGNPFRQMPSLQPRESENQPHMFSPIEEGHRRMREAELSQNFKEISIQVIPSGNL